MSMRQDVAARVNVARQNVAALEIARAHPPPPPNLIEVPTRS